MRASVRIGRRVLVAIPLLAVVAATIIGVRPAGAQVPAEITGITNVGCDVTITIEVYATDDYTLGVWDDGVEVATLPFHSTGGTVVLHHPVVVEPGQSAAGLGFYLYDSQDNELDNVDPYDVHACVPEEPQQPGTTIGVKPHAAQQATVVAPSFTG